MKNQNTINLLHKFFQLLCTRCRNRGKWASAEAEVVGWVVVAAGAAAVAAGRLGVGAMAVEDGVGSALEVDVEDADTLAMPPKHLLGMQRRFPCLEMMKKTMKTSVLLLLVSSSTPACCMMVVWIDAPFSLDWRQHVSNCTDARTRTHTTLFAARCLVGPLARKWQGSFATNVSPTMCILVAKS